MQELVTESRSVRRIVGHLPQGSELIESVLTICQERGVRCGTVTITGVVHEVTLLHYDAAARENGMPRHFRGALQLLLAQGTVAELNAKLDLSLSLLASRLTDNGIQVLGGLCGGAAVVACEFVIEAYEDLLLRRAPDRSTGLNLLSEAFSAVQDPPASAPPADGAQPRAPVAPPASPAPEPPREKDSPPPSRPRRFDGKGQMARVTEPAAPPAPEPPPSRHRGPLSLVESQPERSVSVGDLLDHPKFGRCEVQKTSVDDEFVTVRLRNNRLVRLSLEVLELKFDHEEEGHQIFEVIPASRA